MAARRERERRRPSSERRYDFKPTAPANADLEADAHDIADGTAPAAVATTAPRRLERHGVRPFADYSVEYAYVASDLRRLGIVVGILLILLLVLYFALPR